MYYDLSHCDVLEQRETIRLSFVTKGAECGYSLTKSNLSLVLHHSLDHCCRRPSDPIFIFDGPATWRPWTWRPWKSAALSIPCNGGDSGTSWVYCGLFRLESRFGNPYPLRNDYRLEGQQRHCDQFVRNKSGTGNHLSVNGYVLGLCATLCCRHERERSIPSRIVNYICWAIPIYIRKTNERHSYGWINTCRQLAPWRASSGRTASSADVQPTSWWSAWRNARSVNGQWMRIRCGSA